MRYHILYLLLTVQVTLFAQTDIIPYDSIYSLALDTRLDKVMEILDQYSPEDLNSNDSLFVISYQRRFGRAEYENEHISSNTSEIEDLHKIYQSYWRNAMLGNKNDSTLLESVYILLNKHYPKITKELESIERHYQLYFKERGLFSTGFGKTGDLYDLLVWRGEQDTIYNISNKMMNAQASVVFMEDFLSRGWAAYATLDKYYASGWATKDKLYCVREKYDLNSEKFLVSFLAHESQHFSDYRTFDQLTAAELEYRAKLIELSLAKSTLYDLLTFFINNAHKHSPNSHSKANYYVTQNLSKRIFKKDFERDINKWKKVKASRIRKHARKLIKLNNYYLNLKEDQVPTCE